MCMEAGWSQGQKATASPGAVSKQPFAAGSAPIMPGHQHLPQAAVTHEAGSPCGGWCRGSFLAARPCGRSQVVKSNCGQLDSGAEVEAPGAL